MLTTLKTYGTKDRKLSFILSYANDGVEGGAATLSLFAGKDGITVDLKPEDVKALSDVLSEAHYALNFTN